MSKSTRHWLVKSEPSSYSWDMLVKDGRTAWTGVRNFAARLNLRAMQVGDPVFFYHSVIGKEIVGIAKVLRAAYPDPTAKEGDWSCVDLAPDRPLATPVTLEQIKSIPALKNVALLRQGRLSVMPLSPAEYDAIQAIGKNPQKRGKDS